MLGGNINHCSGLIDSIVTRFAWYAVNVPAVQQESYAGGDGFQPQQISDQTIDAAVLAFWDDAADVQPTPEPEPEPEESEE